MHETEGLDQSARTSQGPELWQCASLPGQPAFSLDCQPRAAAQMSVPSLHPADCAETCSHKHTHSYEFMVAHRNKKSYNVLIVHAYCLNCVCSFTTI